MTHTCNCGATFETCGWNTNINKILRCQKCEQERSVLLRRIEMALKGRKVETVYISNTIRHLIDVSDFTTIEIGYRREEKMDGRLFHVVEA